jgi:hypothetical protein
MFIYNVTVNIDDQVHDEWLNWMREIHMPAVMRSGCFVDSQLLKVLYVDDNGHTYSAQYRFLEMQDIEVYQQKYAATLQAESKSRFADKSVAFRTILQLVE